MDYPRKDLREVGEASGKKHSEGVDASLQQHGYEVRSSRLGKAFTELLIYTYYPLLLLSRELSASSL